jgi:hypothetical protein
MRVFGTPPALPAKVPENLVDSGRDAYAATKEMITRYAELIFDISIISHLFGGWRLATHHESARRLSSDNEFVKGVVLYCRHGDL